MEVEGGFCGDEKCAWCLRNSFFENKVFMRDLMAAEIYPISGFAHKRVFISSFKYS